MKIGIILHPYGEKKPGGLPRMILSWTKAMLENDSENEYIIFLKEKPSSPPDLPGENWTYHVLGTGRFWLDRLKKFPLADVYIFNTPVLPMFYRPTKSIAIALDFPYKYLKPTSFHDYKMRALLSWYHSRSLKRADHVLAISGAAKQDAMKLFGVPEEKISLVPHGYTNICLVDQIVVDLPSKFFFFAGTLKERKNVHRIIDALKMFKDKHTEKQEKLVIAGKKTGKYYQSLLEQIKKLDLQNEVIFLGHVNDGQLSYSYRRATAVVFPSTIEATGNPIIEAMYCGVPVVTSNINGPAELGANDSAILVDPYKTEEIFKGMEKFATDEKFREERIQNGYKQVKNFSWESAAKGLLDVAKKVIDQ